MNTINTAASILAALQVCPRTAKEIAATISKSESVVRENLVKLVAAGSVQKLGDAKPQMFAVPAPVKAKASRPTADGRGNPEVAKKTINLNPQPTLTRKAKIAADAGGSFSYVKTTKMWRLVAATGEELILSPREVATLDYATFEEVAKSGELPVTAEDESEDEGDDE